MNLIKLKEEHFTKSNNHDEKFPAEWNKAKKGQILQISMTNIKKKDLHTKCREIHEIHFYCK